MAQGVDANQARLSAIAVYCVIGVTLTSDL